MLRKLLLVFLLQSSLSDDFLDITYYYQGEYFPSKYLKAEQLKPNVEDLIFYLEGLNRILGYFYKTPNETQINKAVGYYFSKAILKRTIIDYGELIPKSQYVLMKEIIYKCEHVLSHYIYALAQFDFDDMEHRISVLFKDDAPLIHTLGDLSRNKLKKWILSDIQVNDFTEEMDSATLPREKYIDLVESVLKYNITIPDSDACLSRIAYNPEPIQLNDMKPCYQDPYCYEAIKATPSVAYTLSHRLINNFMYYNIRRCYIYSENDDVMHMEMLCAFMYREAVYVARKAYFSRDLFLEHIALCGLMGYEEFFRRHWFRKVISWLDDKGCLKEDRSFEINRTMILKSRTKDPEKLKKLIERRKALMGQDCHEHPMALAMIVLAHGIRQTLHYMK